jgi:hypothetical protein
LSICRAFGNSNGTTITINEIGITLATSYNPTWYFLVTHDLVTQAITNGSSYLVIYTMQTSISS